MSANKAALSGCKGATVQSGPQTSLPPSGVGSASLDVTGRLDRLGVSSRGLSAGDAAARLTRDGPNELPVARGPSVLRRFVAQFTDLFAVMLLVAAVITLIAYELGRPRDAGNLQLAVAILAVVLLNAVIGFGQEFAAERTAEALRAMVPRRSVVLRDGERINVPAVSLVVGDILVLEAGDAVPADAQVIEAHGLTVDNSALTGESEPARRTSDADAGGVAPLDAGNLVWTGTTVSAGTARAVVVATATDTEFGRIYRLTAQTRTERSPLQRQVAAMARRVAVAAFCIGALVFAIRLPSGGPVVTSFVFALGVMVALVPEGLPATMSVALAVGVRRMAHRKALIKKLVAVETLGSTTVICTDKTGTLTKAEMTVQAVWVPDQIHAVSGAGYEPVGDVENPEPLRRMLRAAALCCDARLLPPQPGGRWRVLGDTTEGALLVVAAKAGVDISAEQRAAPRIEEFPFDADRKLMTTVHRVDDTVIAHVKGAPQELLARCTHMMQGDDVVAISDAMRRRVVAVTDDMSRDALRVLGVAYRLVSADTGQAEAERDLILLGLIGMLDPPRPEVSAAIATCQRAGIRIVMVTGDSALTAEAIARKVGLISGASPRALTGADLDRLDDQQLRTVLADPSPVLFARVKPEHKMRVVSTFKDLGEIVAVTGDGANDAPALRRADIGVAMGASGTDVAREAAVMVLLDDSFASIAAAVERGRSVYQNIRTFLIYVFTSNVGELVPIVAATFAGFPLVPLSAVQVLAIDLGSDVLPALALGTLQPEPGTMDKPPRNPREPLFSAAVVRRILFLGGIQAAGVTAVFFWHIHNAGLPFSAFTADNPVYREALTMTQAGIVISQIFVGLTLRSDRLSIVTLGLRSSGRMLAAQGLSLVAICAITYLPPLQRLFHTAALSVADWAILVACGVLLLAADEIRKAVLRAQRRHASFAVA
ncbi:cation-translocating P-type ATPase [Micromonospora ureilytica]|uniref:cation-translocating P-type ATPase n=1 Tax=Micromonospora ureilytica TaxID=709868 RepID=UPI004039994B